MRLLRYALLFVTIAVLLSASQTYAQTSPAIPASPPQSANASAPGQRAPFTPEEAAKLQQAQQQRLLNDWPYLGKYHDPDASLPPPTSGQPRIVFMGDSITQFWGTRGSPFFPDKPYVNRGISGQTTPQMLVRFRQDVIDLKPAVVLILAGINDIAENTGPASLESIENNLMSMADLARAHGIRVVLCSVLPAADIPWHRGLEPAQKVIALNSWIKDYAAKSHLVYLDYYSAMVDDKQGLRADLGIDGVHPNQAGYDVMAPLAEKAIAEALKTKP